MSDDYQSIPVAAARAAVQASGQLEAIQGPQYLSAQSVDWRPYFAPNDDASHPEFARVIVTRMGQAPREVVISWAEYAAELELDDSEWLEKRKQKPMSIFGAEVERHAYRVIFADVLAAALPPVISGAAVSLGDMPPQGGRVTVIPEPTWDPLPPPRDWLAEVSAADAQKLNALYEEAREAGALADVEGLQGAIMTRMLDLEAAKQKPKPAPSTPRPQGQGNRRRRGKR